MKNYTISERTAAICAVTEQFAIFQEAFEKALIGLYGPTVGPEKYEEGYDKIEAVEALLADALFFSVSDNLANNGAEEIV